MLTIKNDKYTVFWGDSLADVGAWLGATPRQWRGSSSTEPRNAYSWDLGASWSDCLRMAREGWAAGAQRLHEGLAAVLPPTTSHTKLNHSVAGHYADVPKYLTGLPDNMITRGKVRGQAPVVSIVVSLTASGSVDASHYANFGAAMVAVIDKLEAAGRRVDLYVAFPNAMNYTRAIVGWKVKEAGEHVDLGALAFSLAHPAAYRRFGFGLWERTGAANYTVGYGRCSDLTEEDAALLGIEDAWRIDGSFTQLHQCTTVEAALAMVIDKVNTAAGEEVVTRD